MPNCDVAVLAIVIPNSRYYISRSGKHSGGHYWGFITIIDNMQSVSCIYVQSRNNRKHYIKQPFHFIDFLQSYLFFPEIRLNCIQKNITKNLAG